MSDAPPPEVLILNLQPEAQSLKDMHPQLLTLKPNLLDSASEYGPRFFGENMRFARFFKDCSHKNNRLTYGDFLCIFCDQMFEIMILVSTSHQCRRQALRITWTSSRKPFTLPDRSR